MQLLLKCYLFALHCTRTTPTRKALIPTEVSLETFINLEKLLHTVFLFLSSSDTEVAMGITNMQRCALSDPHNITPFLHPDFVRAG